MENYKRLLSERIIGKRINAVTVTREKTINISVEEFIREIEGRKIIGIERRAKHLIFKLDSGKNMLLHLMLGGLLYLGNEENELDRTKQVTFSFGDVYLFFIGLRLGYLHLLSTDQISEELSDLGPEPITPTFTLDQFIQLIEKRRGALKTTLVNQKFLAGIGNFYSDEICFEAKLLPTRQANELNQDEKANLYYGIKSILDRGIKLGGYMDVPVYHGDQLTGQYRDNCHVYDREGKSCHRCGALIIKDEISSRKSFYCQQCQK
jgi:formamidopyrimidine-DNA glycosylase